MGGVGYMQHGYGELDSDRYEHRYNHYSPDWWQEDACDFPDDPPTVTCEYCGEQIDPYSALQFEGETCCEDCYANYEDPEAENNEQ